jgi:pyruvate/2-oxoglutarate dehydrogenase complex dihydrolipoamide dehydrogenase (E3) component
MRDHPCERLVVAGSQDFLATADLVLVAVGVQPNSELGASAGIVRGTKGALRVDRFMQTNVAAIYAAGDCVETWQRL